MSLPRHEWLAVVAEAARAPSVHNTQPVRWRLRGVRAALTLHPSRLLAVGDPAGRDAMVSLGAALEGTRIALALRGHGMTDPELGARGAAVRIALGGAAPGEVAEAAHLSALMDARRTHRGPFAATSRETRARLRGWAEAAPDIRLVDAPEGVERLLRLGDGAALGALDGRAYRRELLSWMRLHRGDPRWSRDGLNAEALGLSRIEAHGAGLVLGRAWGPLTRLGAARRLLSERGASRGLAGVVVLHRAEGEHPAEAGRALLRALLDLMALGLQAWPMGALTDDLAARAAVARAAALPDGRVPAAVLRVGRPAEGAAPPRARLGPEEMLR